MITSLLDNDLYQFSMSACLWQAGLADRPVRYEFRNRTFSVPLGSRVNTTWLKDRTEEIRDLRFTEANVAFLRSLKVFPEGWLDWLPSARLPEVHLGQSHGHLLMNYEAGAGEAIFWETLLLALVNQHYFANFGTYLDEGQRRLQEKIDYLKERGTIRFVEFGTRRRFSDDWQSHVVHELTTQIPELLVGTSNVALAQQYDIPAIGTMAHQMFMVLTALNAKLYPIREAIKVATNEVLEMWLETYGEHPNMLTYLPDTYGTLNFIKDADKSLVRQFTGPRQDSGDPIQIGDLLVEYQSTMHPDDWARVVFSDGLDIRSMSVIEDHYSHGQTETPFGWGTNLTNDLGYEPLSLVIKPCAVQHYDGTWQPCVKVSDDVRKATGDPVAVARYLEALGQ